MTVFGDGEQNIYARKYDQETKMPVTPTFKGRWRELSERVSMRMINPDIAALASKFSTHFNLSHEQIQGAPSLNLNTDYVIKYWKVDKSTHPHTIMGNLHWILLTYNQEARDTVALSQNIQTLRDVDRELRKTGARTMTTFESSEEYENIKSRGTNFRKDLDAIRRVKKIHFTTDTPSLKLATIQSFKGWEAKNIILIIPPGGEFEEHYLDENFNETESRVGTAALIYTAITRARCNLFILNMSDGPYDTFFKDSVEQ